MSGPIDPELQAKIASWRIRAAEGTLTIEEMREAVRHLRSGRMSAAAQSPVARRKKAVVEIPRAGDLLDELKGL